MAKIAIIGDIHSNLANLKRALEIIKKNQLSHIIVVGDLQNLETIDIMGTTNVKFSIVFGNADYERDAFLDRAKKYENIKIFGDFGEIELDSKKIGFCHYAGDARKMAKTGKYDVVFSGHRHSPTEEKIGDTIYIRPGEIAGQYFKPTFCIFDLEKMKPELILIN